MLKYSQGECCEKRFAFIYLKVDNVRNLETKLKSMLKNNKTTFILCSFKDEKLFLFVIQCLPIFNFTLSLDIFDTFTKSAIAVRKWSDTFDLSVGTNESQRMGKEWKCIWWRRLWANLAIIKVPRHPICGGISEELAIHIFFTSESKFQKIFVIFLLPFSPIWNWVKDSNVLKHCVKKFGPNLSVSKWQFCRKRPWKCLFYQAISTGPKNKLLSFCWVSIFSRSLVF